MSNSKQAIKTTKAPASIGTYSQAIRCGDLLFVSGQIPLVPESGEVVGDDPRAQIEQAFSNIVAVAVAAGASADHFVKLNIYLTDLAHFPMVNEVMSSHFSEPYPARAAVGVASLPKGVCVEVEGVLSLA